MQKWSDMQDEVYKERETGILKETKQLDLYCKNLISDRVPVMDTVISMWTLLYAEWQCRKTLSYVKFKGQNLPIGVAEKSTKRMDLTREAKTEKSSRRERQGRYSRRRALRDVGSTKYKMMVSLSEVIKVTSTWVKNNMTFTESAFKCPEKWLEWKPRD